MRVIFKSTRYYYWLISGFFRKYSKITVIVFVIAFFAILFSRSVVDSLTYVFTLKKIKIGLLEQRTRERIPPSVLTKISMPIVDLDKKNNFKPGLAKKWIVSDGGKKYRFIFPDKLAWRDGMPFKVQDIDLAQFDFTNIKVEYINDKEILFLLEQPLSNFPGLLTVPVIRSDLVGINGQYKISRIKREYGEIRSITLLPNESGLPVLVYKLNNTQDDLILAYKMGEVDFIVTNNQVMSDTFKKWRNTKIEESIDYQKIVTIFINTQKTPFDNRNLRSAIALGIDYSKLEMFGPRAFSPISPISWAYNPSVRELNFEPEISASLVEKNNSTDKLVKLYSPYELNKVAEIIRKDLNNTGLNVEVKYSNYLPSDYDLFLTIWELPQDPDQYIFWHQTQKLGNFSKLKNLKIDKALEDGRSVISKNTRREIYYKFQDTIIEEVPAVFLFFPKQYSIIRK